MESYDDVIIEFLADKANIRLALEIADRIADVKRPLDRKFWETLEPKLREKFTLPMGWQIFLDRDETGKEIELELYPETSSRQYLYLFINGDELWYGLSWAEEVKKPLRLPEVIRLQEKLRAKGYKSDDRWWPAYHKAAGGVSLRTNQMYVRIATDNCLDLAETLTAALKELFENTRTMIEEANWAIALAISQGTFTA